MKNYISFPHFDSLGTSHPNTYYNLVKNAHQNFKDELHDVYFGKFFTYTWRRQQRRYGNAMGVEATDEQIENLFRLKQEFGIEPSLTLNSLETPHELLDDQNVLNQLIDFIGQLYNKGLRSCIFASNHLIRSNIFHKNFPEMRWKTTVNQKCIDAQSVIDMLFNGYDTIMLDRRLNRDIKELRRIKKAVDHYNNTYKPAKKALTCLLITESCIYNCPFKKEHDSVGEYISANYFSSLSKMTCDNWRGAPYNVLPRTGIDLVAVDSETFNEFYQLVDIFKYSGRFTQLPELSEADKQNIKLAWIFEKNKDKYNQQLYEPHKTIYANSLTEIVENNLRPINQWTYGWINTNVVKDDYTKHLNVLSDVDSIWLTEKGLRLQKILKTCKAQCWNCHECEKTFGVDSYDSGLQL